jgi:5-methylthioadenosine/S-adenosylhomocysteine deaminase
MSPVTGMSGFPEKKGSVLIEGVLTAEGTGDIFISEDGIIEAVGGGVAMEYRGAAEYVLPGHSRIALPGLVNTHTHAAMTLLRGYADDMPLNEWLSTRIWPLEAHLTPVNVYWGTRLACLEMIRTGTVAFNDMYFFMDETARAVRDAGLRAVLSYGFIDLFDEDKREREIRETERFVSSLRAEDNSRIRPAVGPHAVYTVSREGLLWLADYAAEEKILIHVHLSETEKEVKDSERQWGMRPPRILDQCGILTPGTVAAHCCWLSREECALLACRGVHVSHNPVSNMKLAVHRAMPYHWLREEGVNVTLGTDGCASNNNLDLFGEMKAGAILQKFFWNSQTLLPAAEALHMATAAGARALRIGNGTLTPGEPADLVLIDRNAVCNTPLHTLESNMVYACTGSAVQTVICGGDILMLDRYIPGEEEIIREATSAASGLVRRAGLK